MRAPKGVDTQGHLSTPLGARKFGDTLATLAKDQKSKQAAVLVPDFGAAAAAQMQQAAFEAALLGLSPDTRYKSDKAKQEDTRQRPGLRKMPANLHPDETVSEGSGD